MRKYLTRRNIIIAVVVILIGGWWIRSSSRSKTKNGEVKTVTVERGDVVQTLDVSGEIRANKTAVLNFGAPGKLAYVGVKVGDLVKRGQVLAYLDQGDLDAAINRTFYAYEAADAYAKMIEDQVKGHDSDESFTEKNTRVAAQTARDTAYDAWLSARRAKQNSQLVAPFSGIVASVTVNAIGDTASITDGVTVVDPTSLYFSAEVDETDVGKVGLGKQAELSLDAFPDATASGEVSEIDFISQISSTGATVYPVKIVFTNAGKPGDLRVGMNGDANIILEVRKNVLTLPVDAVVDGQVTLPGKEAAKVQVQTGLEGDILVEITGGLKEGDTVLVP